MRGDKTALLWTKPGYRSKMSEAHKGKRSPTKGKRGLWTLSEKTKLKMSAQRKGHRFYGPNAHTKKTKNRIGQSLRNHWKINPQKRQLLNAAISLALKGRTLTAEHCANLSAANKGKKPPEWLVQKRIKASVLGLARRPTKPEKALLDMIERHRLPFAYNGNTAGLMIGNRIPDFVRTDGRKQVAEVFGRAFHDPRYKWLPWPVREGRTFQGTIEHYRNHGYECLIFWEDEISEECCLEVLNK